MSGLGVNRFWDQLLFVYFSLRARFFPGIAVVFTSLAVDLSLPAVSLLSFLAA